MGADDIKIQKEKMVGVLQWPRPKTVKNIQKFLGLVNYYRQFVKDLAKIAKLLHILIRKDEKQNWGEDQKKMFEELKQVFTIQPVLVIPDLDKEMRIEVDISEYAIGGVLLIKCEDNK